MNCTLCKKPIILSPSARERSRKDPDPSHTPAFYASLFPTHSHCSLAKRKADTEELIRRCYPK